jgi:hypothetical protein
MEERRRTEDGGNACSAGMIGDPPFIGGDEAEALTVSEQMFGLQGSLYKISPQFLKIEFADFGLQFC